MDLMEDLSYEYKLPGRSISTVHARFGHALTRHQSSGKIKFRGRKLSAEAVVNAVVLRFLDLSFQDQARVLAAYVPKFEQMMESGDNGFDMRGEEQPSIEDFGDLGNVSDRDWVPPDQMDIESTSLGRSESVPLDEAQPPPRTGIVALRDESDMVNRPATRPKKKPPKEPKK